MLAHKLNMQLSSTLSCNARDRIKAVKEYCLLDAERKKLLTRPAGCKHLICIRCVGNFASWRRDKYQRHIREYWVDVETSGCMNITHTEEVNQCYEIVDVPNAELPAPLLTGKSPLPNLHGDAENSEDSDDDDDDDDDDSDDGSDAPPPKKAKKTKPSSSTGPAGTRANKGRKPTKNDEAIEDALEALYKVVL